MVLTRGRDSKILKIYFQRLRFLTRVSVRQYVSCFYLHTPCIQDTGDSDSEAEQERLAEYEAALKENAPDFVLDPDAAEADNVSQDSPEWYQIHLATERIRIPEILFQVVTRLQGDTSAR